MQLVNGKTAQRAAAAPSSLSLGAVTADRELLARFPSGRMPAVVHSVFAHAVNVDVAGIDTLVTILDASKPMQPRAIRAASLPMWKPGERHQIEWGPALPFDAAVRAAAPWNSPDKRRRRADAFLAALFAAGCPDGIMPLIAGSRRGASRECLWIWDEFAAWQSAVCSCFRDDFDWPALLPASARMIGYGSGLTPFIDDFFCGFMLTMQKILAEPCRESGVRRQRRLAGQTSFALFCASLADVARQKTNRISADLLKLAARGQASQPVIDMFQALFHRESGAVGGRLSALLAAGHSSGTDIGCGIALALRFWCTCSNNDA